MPVGDPASGQVVGAQLHLHLVAREDADVVLAHLPRDGCEHLVPALQLNSEHGARQGLDDLAFCLDLLLFGRHSQRTKTQRSPAPPWLFMVAKALPQPISSGSEAPSPSPPPCARSGRTATRRR